ncbi:MAG: P22 phage major capsid protein family protein [Pseudoclavibacter sp.]
MANSLVTPDVIANGILAAFAEKTLALPLISRDFEQDLTARAQGDTVRVRVPGTFEARDFDYATGVEAQDMTETTTPVTLNTIKDVTFKITDSEMRQEVRSLQEQFLTPAGVALAEQVNSDIIAKLLADATTEVGTGSLDARPWAHNSPRVLVDARAKLNTARAPQADRAALIGTETAADWLSTDLLIRADQSGDTAALRDAQIGRLAGFTAYETVDIAAPAESPAVGDPTTEVSVAFHKQAVAGAFTTLESAANSGSVIAAHDGLAVRVTLWYDGKFKTTFGSADVLYGLNSIRPEWITLIKGADEA